MRQVSECGNYLALFLPQVYTLKIHNVDSKLLEHAYDIGASIKQHLLVNNLPYPIKVGKIRWEPVEEGQRSTKIAVSVDNYSLVIIYDIRNVQDGNEVEDEEDPMIIQQDSSDGIEDFFWVPAVSKLYEDQEPGAYINSRQLLIYTKKYLQVKLYSLDCTHIVWKLSKPVSRQPLINPSDRRLWSLVLESRSPKANDLNPIVYHFYNDGSISNLLYRFKLPNILLSDSIELDWSQSGKWLIYFNYVDTLFGFNLQVFNALGVNQRQEFNQSDIIPMGDPIIDVNWLIDGFEEDHSPIEIGNLKYHLTSIAIDDIADYIIVASVNEVSELELITTSVKDFRIINKALFEDFSKLVFWRQAFDGDNIYYTKTRSDIRGSPLTIKDLFVVKQPKIKLLVVQFEEAVLISEILVKNDAYNKLISYNPIQFIMTDKIVSIETPLDMELFVLTSSHIFSYNLNQISVIYQNFPSINQSEFKYKDDTLKLILFPDSDVDDWLVQEIDQKHEFSPEKNVSSSSNFVTPPKTDILKLFNRFHDNRTLATSFTEENTDTFVNKRMRRN